MKNRYVVFYHRAHENMYRDIRHIKEVQLIEQDSLCSYAFVSRVLNKLKVLYNIHPRIFGWTYYFISAFEKMKIIECEHDNLVFFLNDCTLDRYHTRYLIDVKKKYPNIKFVVQWLNVVSTVPDVYYQGMTKLDPVLVLTDDPADAEKYKWVFWMDCFSLEEVLPIENVGDVFFAGLAKGREEKIYEAYDVFTANGISCSFTVVGANRPKKGINTSRMPYSQLLSYDKYCKCILEIMQEGQVGYTCRAQEAICLNKKLLTNNRWIVNSKYYNPEFIRIFETIGKEEVAFVEEQVEVDYKYDNGFSSVKLIEFFENNI